MELQDGGDRVGKERLDVFKLTYERPLNVKRGAITEGQHDQFGRRAEHYGKFTEVVVFGDDNKAGSRRVAPNIEIVGPLEPLIAHVAGFGKFGG